MKQNRASRKDLRKSRLPEKNRNGSTPVTRAHGAKEKILRWGPAYWHCWFVQSYDAMGRLVEQARGGSDCAHPGTNYQQIVYGPGGGKLALMNAQTLTKAFVPLPGGATAVYNSTGLAYYRHSDHLGSSRLASTPARTPYYTGAYAPFGENYTESGTTDRSFTGQNQDTVPGLNDFMFREHTPNQGRWISPDPAGLAAVSLTDPQTWNRYAYVMNRPLTNVDPLGLDQGTNGEGDAGCGDDWYDAGNTEECFGGSSGPPATDCVLDGVETNCNSVFQQIDNGNAGICPNNDCNGMRLGSDGQFQYWVPQSRVNGLTAANGMDVTWIRTGYWTNVSSSSSSPQQYWNRGYEDEHPGLKAFYNNPDCPHCGDILNSTNKVVDTPMRTFVDGVIKGETVAFVRGGVPGAIAAAPVVLGGSYVWSQLDMWSVMFTNKKFFDLVLDRP